MKNVRLNLTEVNGELVVNNEQEIKDVIQAWKDHPTVFANVCIYKKSGFQGIRGIVSYQARYGLSHYMPDNIKAIYDYTHVLIIHFSHHRVLCVFIKPNGSVGSVLCHLGGNWFVGYFGATVPAY